MAPSQAGSSSRLTSLDGLRGIAVLAVLVSHAGERVFPLIDHINTQWFQMGQFGVTLFFLISGFVIPMTAERRTLRMFWTARVLRLFPLYLVALATAGVLTAVGIWHRADDLTVGQWLLNTTMLQGLLAQPNAMTVAWSLTWEMLFYLVMSVLLCLRINRHSAALALVALTLANVDAVRPLLGSTGWYPLWWMFMAQLFTGTVLFRHMQGRLSGTTALGVSAYYVVTALHVTWSYMGGHPSAAHGTWGFIPMSSAWIAAILVFGAWYVTRDRRMPRALVWTGTVSYSVYLVHPLVMDLGRPLGGAAPVVVDGKTTVALYFVASLGLAWVSHSYVEKPAMRLARRLTTRPERRDTRRDAGPSLVETTRMPFVPALVPTRPADRARPLALAGRTAE
jgi:peptidoglycan/LPS O-acetylase OafA/YrhL